MINEINPIKFKLLIIFKVGDIRKTLLTEFYEHPEFNIDVSSSLKESVKLLSTNEYDAVLIGLDLPDSKYNNDIKTFYELILKLKEDKVSHISFIVLTENNFKTKYSEVQFRSMVFNAGAQDIFYIDNIKDIKLKMRGLIRCIEDSTSRTNYILNLIKKINLCNCKDLNNKDNSYSLINFFKKFK